MNQPWTLRGLLESLLSSDWPASRSTKCSSSSGCGCSQATLRIQSNITKLIGNGNFPNQSAHPNLNPNHNMRVNICSNKTKYIWGRLSDIIVDSVFQTQSVQKRILYILLFMWGMLKWQVKYQKMKQKKCQEVKFLVKLNVSATCTACYFYVN